MYVIYMLWLRQLKRYARSRSRIVGALGQPVLYLVALGFGFGPVFRKAGEGDYIQFLTPGVVGMTVLFTSVFSGIELIWDRQFGFLKETLVAPVPRLIIMLGRTLGGATVAVGQGLLVLLICLLVGFRLSSPSVVLWAGVYMTLIALMFTAFGTAMASMLSDFQGFQLVMNFLVMPIFFLSGALFPLAGAPRAMTVIAAFDPLAYGVDGLRRAVAGTAYFSPLTDLGVLVGASAVLLALGSYLFSRIEL
jgi:ABC-2 type transport system permease protein